MRWLVLMLVLAGCSKPQQLGGLGVFNPKGIQARLEHRERLKPEKSSDARTPEKAVEPSNVGRTTSHRK